MDQKITEQIRLANETLGKTNYLYAAWAKSRGLNYNSLMVLYSIHGMDACTQKKISDYWMIPKQTINSILKDFKEKGYVCTAEAGMNKKEKQLVFTAAGRVYAEHVLADLLETEERAMRAMGQELRDQFVKSGIAFLEALKKEMDHG